MAEDVAHAWNLMEEIRICMLVTRDGRKLRSRPMGAYVRRHEKAVYFLTDLRHHKDEEIKAAHQVCLAFADISGEKYASVTGSAELVNDRAKVKELWSTEVKAWWETADDPNIRILKVTPTFAEYWDSLDAVANYVELAAAALAGEEPDIGEHRKVRM